MVKLSRALWKSERVRHLWSSKWEYFSAHAIYVIYQAHHYQNASVPLNNRLQFGHALVCLLLVGLPLQYMQTVVGQYSQSSAALLKNMTPIAHGIVYSYLLVSFLRLIQEAVLAGDAILYLLNSMQSELPWLSCEKFSADNCWFGYECKNAPCLNENVTLAASKYWHNTFMGLRDGDGGYSSRSSIDVRRLVTTIFTWTIVYIILFLSKKLMPKFLRYTFLTSMAMRLMILLLLILVSFHGFTGFVYILSTAYEDLLNIHTWARQLIGMLCYMSIGRGGNIMLGSFFKSNQSTGIFAVFSTIFVSSLYILILESFLVANESLAHYTGVKDASLVTKANVHECIEFILIPTCLAYTELTQFWSILYFLAMFLNSTCHLILNIKIMHLTLEDLFPLLAQYSKFILMSSYLLYIVLSTAFVTKQLFLYTNPIHRYILDLFEALITLIFVLSVGWIYGVQKLCDDVHFIIGSQPTKFWKASWYVSPIIIFLGLVFYILDTEDLEFLGYYEKIYVIIAEVFLVSPVLCLATYEMINHIRNRKIVGVVQMTTEWGPISFSERQERKMFNPRKETKARRRNEQCQHSCLLKSTILDQVLAEEYALNLNTLETQFNSELELQDQLEEIITRNLNEEDIEQT